MSGRAAAPPAAASTGAAAEATAVAGRLVLGLGNPLAGDDGIGAVLAERLAGDPRLPPDVEARAGGADLLRLAPALAGRRHVVLVDATFIRLGEAPLLVRDHAAGWPGDAQRHVHELSPLAALDLLRVVVPALAATRFTWALVPIDACRLGPGLSPDLADRVPALLDELLAML